MTAELFKQPATGPESGFGGMKVGAEGRRQNPALARSLITITAAFHTHVKHDRKYLKLKQLAERVGFETVREGCRYAAFPAGSILNFHAARTTYVHRRPALRVANCRGT
jgi:hypothetical protein